MPKKILILNGSPRKNGNTAGLTAAFAKGARDAGNEVREFFPAHMKIAGCMGCWQGGKDPEAPCVQRDDMYEIYPEYRRADVIVLASPVYYMFFSGFLKNAFDRLFAIAECDPGYINPPKECVLLMAAEEAVFEESEYWYDRLDMRLGWKSLGKVLCPFVTRPGDIEGREELEKAYELGASIS